MISRQTIFSLLVALLLGGGMYAWTLEHRDDCARYLGGDKTVPSSEQVESGTRTIVVPCNVWIPRQSLAMQTLALAELCVFVVFVLSAWTDVMKRRRSD